MLARVLSAAVHGIDAYLVGVEADVASGLPTFATVGLPQGAVKESEKRVLAAVRNSGYEVPPRRILVNLAPADIRKEGSAFDLPIAIGILIGSGQLNGARVERLAMVGELGLDGGLRAVRGVLSIAMAAREAGLETLIVPRANVGEAAVVEGLDVRGADDLRSVAAYLAGGRGLARARFDPTCWPGAESSHDLDFADVRGQEHAKRALEVAAAGGHNVLMIGPPGSGKTMLARRIPSILPPLTLAEALETTRVHSVAGTLESGRAVIMSRPFRAPHHTISDAGLVGGGSSPRPGEISLAHNGVLFLDELPEFRRNVLEALRQPVEDAEVTVSRSSTSVTYPARCMLVAAMNPCPCGFSGDARRPCACVPPLIERYLARISGPLMDRIDIHVAVPAVAYSELSERRAGEASSAIRERVTTARELQRDRLAGVPGVYANAHMRPRDLRAHCFLGPGADALLKTAISRLGFTARAYHRVLKIARTIADLEGIEALQTRHVAEAIQYRSLDRRAPP